jgi:molybdate transport system substrate-binding protein
MPNGIMVNLRHPRKIPVTLKTSKALLARLIFPLHLLLPALLCVDNAVADTLSVAVAANVQYVFDEIRLEFKKETGHEIRATYNSSGKFVTQIINGAPFDVFLSADMEYPEYLSKQAYTTAAPKIYAYGTLVLWTMKKRDLSQWQSLLSGNTISKIALANPKTAPYGREALKTLASHKPINTSIQG